MKKLLNKAGKIFAREWVWVLLILLAGLAVRFYKIDNPIADWHSWRQADTASVTKIYLEKGIDVLAPKYQDISSVQTGIFNSEGLRLVEFPIYNIIHTYLVKLLPIHLPPFAISKVWKSIGYNPGPIELWGRLISIASSLASGIFLFLIGRKLYGKWVGILAMAVFMFMPYNIYFSRVILPEPMSVAFAVMGLYFFVIYIEKEKLWKIVLSGVLFGLSLLVKPFSAFYLLAPLYLVYSKYKFSFLKNPKVLIPGLLFLNIALIPFFVWRVWINQNPVGIPHFTWAFNGDGIRFKPAFWRWIFSERLGNLMLGVWGMIPFGFGLLTKSKSKYPYFLHFFLLGSLFYVTTFATASVRHDYYQTFVVPSVALALGYGIWAMWSSTSFNKIAVRILLLFSLMVMFISGWIQVKEDFNVNHPEIIIAGAYVDRTVPKDAIVIAPYTGDTAFLYQTGRSGWPVVEDSIDKLIERGAQYYVNVNFADPDIKMLQSRFKTIETNSTFVLIDLTQPLKK